jgi:wyosine [tRNA(Phe)-imidazoG37] synthetase (radical SAM superfamily)
MLKMMSEMWMLKKEKKEKMEIDKVCVKGLKNVEENVNEIVEIINDFKKCEIEGKV